MSIYDKASIALIPSGTKASKLYSVLPANGDGDFTHSRGSTATRVNKDGLIESVANNVPRLDYPLSSGVVGDCPHLLLEPSRTNLIYKSEELDNSAWSKTNCTVTANQEVSPDGNVTADKVTTTQNTSFVYQNRSMTSGTTYTYSAFVKKGDLRYYKLWISHTFGSQPSTQQINFDLDNKTTTTFTSTQWTSSSIEDYGNGWLRCIATTTSGSHMGYSQYNSFSDNNNSSNYQGSVGYGYIWGVQMEIGTYATSYIPNTTTGSITRSADFCGSSGTSAEFNDTESSFFVEIQAFAEENTNRYIVINDGAGSPYTNSLIIQYRNNGTLRIFHNGIDFADAIYISGASFDQTENHKIAVRFKENDMKVYIDGVSQSLSSSFVYQSISGLDRLAFNLNNISNTEFRGKIKQAIVFNEALSDSELETLTS